VEKVRVVEGLQDGLLDRLGIKGELVGRLIAANERLQLLLLREVPIEEAKVAIRDLDGSRCIDGLFLGGGGSGFGSIDGARFFILFFSLPMSGIRPNRGLMAIAYLVEGELHPLNEVEGDGVFQAATRVSASAPGIRQDM
jgi:hypothetical protein